MATKATSLTGTADGAPARSQAGLSIVVPVFNEATGLSRFHDRLVELARTLRRTRGLKCEVVYVDDGSRDETFAVASALPAEALDIQIIALSRNFGKEAALMAGLDHARLGGVLFMDGDGQHPPSLVERLVSHWLDDGYDVVYTAKAHRGTARAPPLQREDVSLSSIEGRGRKSLKMPAIFACSHRAPPTRYVVARAHRFFKGLASWIGFRQIRVDYEPAERLHGSTSWNLRSLIGLSIEGLTSFSVAPLRLASLFGLLLAVSAFIFGTKIFIEAVFFGIEEKGYASMVIGIMVIGGVQLVMIGVLGEYIGKVLSEIKARPVYFVAEHSIKSAKESADSATARTAAE
jgi:glycosyltransferase involved in cell wall biosynthesis